MTASLKSRLFVALCGATLVAVPFVAGADVDFRTKLKAGGISEDSRDLTETGEDTQAGYLDLQPQFLAQSENFGFFFRGQAFLPSNMMTQDEQNEPVQVENYAALRELWVEYGGLTDYPGEVLRLGLQRLKTPDGIWWDRDIETARWIFDTTLFQFEVGAAKAFNNYRSDNIELPESQRDRAYGLLGLSTQWVPRHYVGIHGAYATDQRELPENGAQMTLNSSTTDPATGATTNEWDTDEQRRYGWVGVYLDNRFYEFERGPGMTYRFEVMGMTGSREYTVADPASGRVVGRATEDVNALAGDGELRARFPDPFPLQIGAAYAYGQGGRDENGSHVFRQTGLQSNRSRFTGTRTIVNRFNEALQADLSNIRVSTAYLSLPLENWDVSAIGSAFQRDDAASPVYTDGIDARPDPNSTSNDLGRGFDFVLTRHFAQLIKQRFAAEDDTRSNIRLRASRFMPGEAYAQGLKDQNRVVLEGTLWF